MNGIPYTVWQGTLISANRDGYIPPWDSRDVDIAVSLADFGACVRRQHGRTCTSALGHYMHMRAGTWTAYTCT